MSRRTHRRDFLKTSAVAGVGFFAATGYNLRESRAANETINFACIGVGGKGDSDSEDAARSGNIVAICDIDETQLNRTTQKKLGDAAPFEKAKKYFDFRTMFDELGKSIDAVTISTPDHTHAPATARALRMGIACYTQKPMTHTIYEARLLGQLAREHKAATQMGNQFTAHPSLRKAAAVVKAGTLGKVTEAHVWTNRPIWPQGLERPKETQECPPTIHWEQFLGPAPERPYNQAYHPFKWRGWWDFGTGALGDMACHTLNMPFAALSLRNPISVEAKTAGHNKETYPAWSVIEYHYAATDARPALKMVWYDGGKLPPAELFKGKDVSSSGVLLIGDKDTMYAPGDYAENGLQLLSGAAEPDVDYKRSPGHFKEFVNAIKGGEPAMSNFPDYASPLTETVLLGNLAVWADGKKVEWDAEKLVASNMPELDVIIRKPYRAGWEL